MTIDRLIGNAKLKLGTVSVTLLLLVGSNVQVFDMREDLGTLKESMATVQAGLSTVQKGLGAAQVEQARTEERLKALRERVEGIQGDLDAHKEASALPLARWYEALRQWEPHLDLQPGRRRR